MEQCSAGSGLLEELRELPTPWAGASGTSEGLGRIREREEGARLTRWPEASPVQRPEGEVSEERLSRSVPDALLLQREGWI